jgi:hypothetical protein
MLAACQQSQQDVPVSKAAVCRMLAIGAPDVAARAALSRNDYRVLTHYSNGESPHTNPLGVEYAGRAGKLDPLWYSTKIDGHECGREIDISEGETPACCDQPAPFTVCGEKQYAYAAAYNREVIKSARFRNACGAYKPDQYGKK